MRVRDFYIFSFISRKNKIGMVFAFILMLLSSVAELITIASVVPFISILVSGEAPELPIFGNISLNLFPFSNSQLLFTSIFVSAVIFSGIVRLFYLWYQVRLNNAIGSDFATKIYTNLLGQSYSGYLGFHSSDFLSGVSKADSMIGAVIAPLFSIANGILLFIAVFLALFSVDKSLTLMATGSFAILYVTIFFSLRMKLKSNAEIVTRCLTDKLRSIQEAFAAYREIFIYKMQAAYTHEFRQLDWNWRRAQASTVFLSSSPRLLVETIGLVLIAFACLAYLGDDADSKSLATLGAFALGAQRILPAVQLIYSGFANIRGGQGYLRDTLALLDVPVPQLSAVVERKSDDFGEIHALLIDDLGFCLDGKWLFKKLSVVIPNKSFVGIVGRTGCGKTTLLEVLMGLRAPQEGRLVFDGVELNETSILWWHSQIALVPQEVHLIKGTIVENVAMSNQLENVDMQLLQRCLDHACLSHEVKSFARGLQTVVGEGGVKLSGGQRQRLGIARALFRQPKLLFLDEATSNLDEFVEQELIQSILEHDPEMTIIMVAHRLSSLDKCDLILSLEPNGVRLFETIEGYVKR